MLQRTADQLTQREREREWRMPSKVIIKVSHATTFQRHPPFNKSADLDSNVRYTDALYSRISLTNEFIIFLLRTVGIYLNCYYWCVSMTKNSFWSKTHTVICFCGNVLLVNLHSIRYPVMFKNFRSNNGNEHTYTALLRGTSESIQHILFNYLINHL